jgi:hypothetical protein
VILEPDSLWKPQLWSQVFKLSSATYSWCEVMSIGLRRVAKKKTGKKFTLDLPKDIESKIVDDPRIDRRARFVKEVLGFLRDLVEKYSKIDSERARKMSLVISDLEHWWNKDLEYFNSKTLIIGDKKLVSFFGKVLDSETFVIPSTYLFSGLASITLFFNSLSYLKFGIEWFIELINDIKYDLENKGAPRELIAEIDKDLSKLEELLNKYERYE